MALFSFVFIMLKWMVVYKRLMCYGIVYFRFPSRSTLHIKHHQLFGKPQVFIDRDGIYPIQNRNNGNVTLSLKIAFHLSLCII